MNAVTGRAAVRREFRTPPVRPYGVGGAGISFDLLPKPDGDGAPSRDRRIDPETVGMEPSMGSWFRAPPGRSDDRFHEMRMRDAHLSASHPAFDTASVRFLISSLTWESWPGRIGVPITR